MKKVKGGSLLGISWGWLILVVFIFIVLGNATANDTKQVPNPPLEEFVYNEKFRTCS